MEERDTLSGFQSGARRGWRRGFTREGRRRVSRWGVRWNMGKEKRGRRRRVGCGGLVADDVRVGTQCGRGRRGVDGRIMRTDVDGGRVRRGIRNGMFWKPYRHMHQLSPVHRTPFCTGKPPTPPAELSGPLFTNLRSLFAQNRDTAGSSRQRLYSLKPDSNSTLTTDNPLLPVPLSPSSRLAPSPSPGSLENPVNAKPSSTRPIRWLSSRRS